MIVKEENNKKSTSESGYIRNSSDLDYLHLKIDNSSVNISGEALERLKEIFGNSFKLELIDGEIKIDFDLVNEDGVLVARLKENNWKYNKENVFDCNYDENGMEIIDSFGRIRLILYKVAGGYAISGLFYNQMRKVWIAFYPNRMVSSRNYKLGYTGAISYLKAPLLENDTSLQILKSYDENMVHLFKFPSEKYFLERVKNRESIFLWSRP